MRTDFVPLPSPHRPVVITGKFITVVTAVTTDCRVADAPKLMYMSIPGDEASIHWDSSTSNLHCRYRCTTNCTDGVADMAYGCLDPSTRIRDKSRENLDRTLRSWILPSHLAHINPLLTSTSHSSPTVHNHHEHFKQQPIKVVSNQNIDKCTLQCWFDWKEGRWYSTKIGVIARQSGQVKSARWWDDSPTSPLQDSPFDQVPTLLHNRNPKIPVIVPQKGHLQRCRKESHNLYDPAEGQGDKAKTNRYSYE